jgi:hypothetical protein
LSDWREEQDHVRAKEQDHVGVLAQDNGLVQKAWGDLAESDPKVCRVVGKLHRILDDEILALLGDGYVRRCSRKRCGLCQSIAAAFRR